MTVQSPSESGSPPLIVTGLSGAGMSTALKHLEDIGYEVFDNFPLTMVKPLLDDPASAGHPIAVGIDSRTRGFDTDNIIATARALKAQLVFINCEENELLQRFTETRRRHPLAKDRPALAGIKQEQSVLYPLRRAADIMIDSTGLSVHDLRHVLTGHFDNREGLPLTITLMSFGFRHGLPREADIILDVRFLKNPHWVDDLRPLTGKDKAVGDYVASDEDFADFITHTEKLLAPLLPRYQREGKSYLTIAIGCTGGRHRSVYSVEILKKWLQNQDIHLNIQHRDITR